MSSVLVATSLVLRAHQVVAWVVVLGNGLAGAWALGAHRFPAVRSRLLWWFTLAMQLSIFVQAGLGVGLLSGQHLHAPSLHVFYGFVAIISVAIIYSYRSQMARYRYLLYGFGGLFLMGLGIRAMFLA